MADGEQLLRVYLAEIRRHDLLGPDEEVDLAIAIETGRVAEAVMIQADAAGGVRCPDERRLLTDAVAEGQAAKVRFIASNLRLVVSVARRYTTPGLALLDLIQDGNIGLVQAVDGFDWRLGHRFSTYATKRINRAITRAIENTGRTVRLPTHVWRQLSGLRIATASFEKAHGRTPTVKELAQIVGVSETRVQELQLWGNTPISLSRPLEDGNDEGTELADVLADEGAESPLDAAVKSVESTEVARRLERLTDREREVLVLRFGLDGEEPRTCHEIGQRFEISGERVRQIESSALQELRRPPDRYAEVAHAW